jgi:hypothetical protein
VLLSLGEEQVLAGPEPRHEVGEYRSSLLIERPVTRIRAESSSQRSLDSLQIDDWVGDLTVQIDPLWYSPFRERGGRKR